MNKINLTFQYIRRHKMYFYMMKSLCLFTAGFYFGDMLHEVFIDLLVALALYALGHKQVITALSSRKCLYQQELVGPMRWVKVFLQYL